MWTTTAIGQSGVQVGTQAGDTVALRQTVFAMTDEAETAVLRPAESGAWPHALRAALASRAARISALPDLAEHYFQMIDDSQYQSLAYTDNNGAALGLGAVITFMDKVASSPRDVVDADVKVLQKNNIADADIVRLAEINAFMSYQIRLVAGLTMLSGGSA